MIDNPHKNYLYFYKVQLHCHSNPPDGDNDNAPDELFRKYHAQMRSKRMIKAVSDILRVPYLWAYFEAAFYVEATRQ